MSVLPHVFNCVVKPFIQWVRFGEPLQKAALRDVIVNKVHLVSGMQKLHMH